MKLIVGLGNPTKEYEKTRHNIGFLFLDFLKTSSQVSPSGNEVIWSDFKFESKFKAEISSGIFDGEKTLLVKPQTYMNLSGESVRKIVDFYKIDLEDIIVIYDDLSMEFGKIRFRDKGSAGGHNGIKSIIKHFSNQFKRIKIGIGFNENYEVSDWVLSKFNEEELNKLEKNIFNKVYKILKEKL